MSEGTDYLTWREGVKEQTTSHGGKGCCHVLWRGEGMAPGEPPPLSAMHARAPFHSMLEWGQWTTGELMAWIGDDIY